MIAVHFLLQIDGTQHALPSHRLSRCSIVIQLALAGLDDCGGGHIASTGRAAGQSPGSVWTVRCLDVCCARDARPAHVNEVRVVQAARNLGSNAILFVVHPARDHFLAHETLLVGQIGCPKLRRFKTRVLDLLVPIPLRKILAQIFAELHAMRFRIACIARELLGKLLEPAGRFRIGLRSRE